MSQDVTVNALWGMYVSIMPGVVDTPEHRDKLQTIISISGGQARAVQYLESVQHSLQPNDLQIGVIFLHISVSNHFDYRISMSQQKHFMPDC